MFRVYIIIIFDLNLKLKNEFKYNIIYHLQLNSLWLITIYIISSNYYFVYLNYTLSFLIGSDWDLLDVPLLIYKSGNTNVSDVETLLLLDLAV